MNRLATTVQTKLLEFAIEESLKIISTIFKIKEKKGYGWRCGYKINMSIGTSKGNRTITTDGTIHNYLEN